MLSTQQITDVIADAVSELSFPEEPKGLYEPIKYTLESGGKRLRPHLLLAVCSAKGGDVKSALPAAIGVEIFHNFTLLHDDVMDSADLRRGRLTVHRRWNANTAILSGDAMLTFATMELCKTDGPILRPLLSLFNKTAMEVYEGQQLDTDFEKVHDVRVGEYINMIRLKTSVLLGCACKMGAIIAGCEESEADAFYDYGVNLGLAFQLRDDWLDTFGDPLIFGKQIGGDIINAKKTWLLITAIEECEEETLGVLAEDLDPKERVSQIKAIYNRLKLSERCMALIKSYSEQAIASLDKVNLGPEAVEFFKSLALKSVERTN